MPVKLPQKPLREQQVVDALQQRDIQRHHYFTFTNNDLQAYFKNIILLPRNSLINNVIIRVLDSFDGNETFLYLGTQSNTRSIAVAHGNTTGVVTEWVTKKPEGKFGEIFSDDTLVVLTKTESGKLSLKGAGWGLISYLDMNLISSFNRS